MLNEVFTFCEATGNHNGGMLMVMQLFRYAEMLGLTECGVYGVKKDDQPSWACRVVWSPTERILMNDALNIAQDKIERELRFPLSAKFVCDEIKPWGKRGHIRALDWSHAHLLGIRTYSDIELGVDLPCEDPAVITVTTTVTEPCEIYVRHTAENGGERIYPSSVTISGGVATITIPRCRLVDYENVVQPSIGYDYLIDSNFVREVDVLRRYIDETTGQYLRWAPNVAGDCCDENLCELQEQSACGVIEDTSKSWVHLWPAAYESGAWASKTFAVCDRYPDLVRLNYLANYNASCGISPYCEDVPRALEQAIVRLAHTELPMLPCGCPLQQSFWEADRKEIEDYNLITPFGLYRGAVYAWHAIRQYISGGGGVF